MKRKKIFAGLVLAVFLFVIPQAVAQASDMQGTYSGTYDSSTHHLSDRIEFTIDSEGNLNGVMVVRELKCDINLKLIAKIGDREVYRGTFTRTMGPFTWKYDMTMQMQPITDTVIKGNIRIPGLRFMAAFVAELPALPPNPI